MCLNQVCFVLSYVKHFCLFLSLYLVFSDLFNLFYLVICFSCVLSSVTKFLLYCLCFVSCMIFGRAFVFLLPLHFLPQGHRSSLEKEESLLKKAVFRPQF